MKGDLEPVGGLKWCLTVELPADELEKRVDTRLKEMRHTVRLPGFRPGKIPAAQLRRRFGDQVCREQAERMGQSEVRDALGARGLRPVAAPQLTLEGLPSVQAKEEPDAPRVVATFEVFPPLPAIELSNLEVQVPRATIGEADVDGMLSRLQAERSSWVPASAPSQSGDRISISLSARGAKGRWPRKGNRRVEQVVGEEGPASFLGEALLGLEWGQRLERLAQPPAGSEIAALAGATATVSGIVNAVHTRRLPELDSTFLRDLGIEDGQLETLRHHLAEVMEGELEEALQAERLLLVERALISQYPDIELPESLLEDQMKRLGEAIPEDQALQPDDLAAEARSSLATTFLFAEVARQRSLGPDPTRLWKRTRELADQADDPKAELDRIWGDGDLIQEIEEELLRQEVAAVVLAEAKVSETAMSFSELAQRRRER